MSLESTLFKWLARSGDKARALRGLTQSLGARLELVPNLSQHVETGELCAWLVDCEGLENPESFFQTRPSFVIGAQECHKSLATLGWTDASFYDLSQSRMIDFCIGFLSKVYMSYEDVLGWGYHLAKVSQISDLRALQLEKRYQSDIKSVYKLLKAKKNLVSSLYTSDGVTSAFTMVCDDPDICVSELAEIVDSSILLKIRRDHGCEIVVIHVESFSQSFTIELCWLSVCEFPRYRQEPMMSLMFHGVRGSRPTHKKTLLEYGGNSTCLEFCLPHEDFYLFLDCGSGLAHRGMEIGEQSEHQKFYWLMTHTHWDHILGLPFFEPFYNSENRAHFFASQTSRSTFDDLLTGVKRAQNLPVPIQNFQAEMKVQTICAGESFEIENSVQVSTYQINHQGITLAYRVHYREDSVAVVTDNAPIEKNYLGENMPTQPDAEYEKRFNQGLVDFLKGCHTVVFDTHFTEENLKPDWGHSTPERALQFCIEAGVKRLILFHHAPEDQDSDVFDKVKSIYALAQKHGIEVVAAREGKQWMLR